MRVINFRGKCCGDGEWVYGSYLNAEYHWHKRGVHNDWIVVYALQNGGWVNVTRKYPVKPETVGQFTGLYDKNGKEIYEGDIVRTKDLAQVVKFCRIGYDSGVGLVGYVCCPISSTFDRTSEDYNTHEQFYECDRCIDLKDVEIIGNIYDNPEQLEEEDADKG